MVKKKVLNKRFIVRKYIMAQSAKQALKLEKQRDADDVYVDSEWIRDNPNQLESAIGFVVNVPEEFE